MSAFAAPHTASKRCTSWLPLLTAAVCTAPAMAEEGNYSLAASAAATFDGLSADFGLIESRRAIGTGLTLAAGVAYLYVDDRDREMQFRARATATTTFGDWQIDNRNLLTVSSRSIRQFRNRLRFTSPAPHRRLPVRLHVYDELYFDVDYGRVLRNNVALGLGSAVGACCNIEVYQVWSDNRIAEDTRYLLAIVSVTLRR